MKGFVSPVSKQLLLTYNKLPYLLYSGGCYNSKAVTGRIYLSLYSFTFRQVYYTAGFYQVTKNPGEACLRSHYRTCATLLLGLLLPDVVSGVVEAVGSR